MQRLLLEGERPVKVGSRSLEILMVLVANAGRLIGKAQLMASVWPSNIVEEAALRVHVASLRKALGDGLPGRRYITTVPQRGYAFVAPVRRDPEVHVPAQTRETAGAAAPPYGGATESRSTSTLTPAI
jgi:DNA-binding winged helix-turn-helix (wHTH) protein